MDQLSKIILIDIASYLRADDVANFSMICRMIRECTMELKHIDLTQIIYCYSKLELLNILKLLRFHTFTHWIIPTSLIFKHHWINPHLLTLIINWLQHKYNYKYNNDDNLTESIILRKYLPFNRDILHRSDDKSWNICLKMLSLRHLSIEDPQITIWHSTLEQSYKTLKSLEIATLSNLGTNEIETISKIFPNLQILALSFFGLQNKLNAKLNYPDFHLSQFHNLQILIIKGQIINFQLQYLLAKLATFPVLETCYIEYCKFIENRKHAIKAVNSQKSILHSLYFKGITVIESDLNVIGQYFGSSLKYLSFKRCKIPMVDEKNQKSQIWEHFANNCQVLETLIFDELLSKADWESIIYFSIMEWQWEETVFSQLVTKKVVCKKDLNYMLTQTFDKNNKNLRILVDGDDIRESQHVQIINIIRDDYKQENILKNSQQQEMTHYLQNKCHSWQIGSFCLFIDNQFMIMRKKCEVIDIFEDDEGKKIKVRYDDREYVLAADNPDVFPLIDWIKPKEYELCKLCDCKVGTDDGLMDDHLDTICENALIKCSLCLTDGIKRCEMTNHWDNECVGYEYLCGRCLGVFVGRKTFYKHRMGYNNVDTIDKNELIDCNLCLKEGIKRGEMLTHWNNACLKYQYSCSRCLDVFVGRDKFYKHRMEHERHSHEHSHKGLYYFENDEIEYKDNYCHQQSIELGWICDKCQQRCFGDKNSHIHWGSINTETGQHLLGAKCLSRETYVSRLIVYGWMRRMENNVKLSYKIPGCIVDIISSYHTIYYWDDK